MSSSLFRWTCGHCGRDKLPVFLTCMNLPQGAICAFSFGFLKGSLCLLHLLRPNALVIAILSTVQVSGQKTMEPQLLQSSLSSVAGLGFVFLNSTLKESGVSSGGSVNL